jgi:hypothetical protein
MKHYQVRFRSVFWPGGFLMLVLGLFLLSCNVPRDNARTKSLNNFARNNNQQLQRNVCKADQTPVSGINAEWDHTDFSAVPPEKLSAVRHALETALTAVPQNLQQLYFGLGGTIVFSSTLNVPANSKDELTCPQDDFNRAFASEGTGEIDACWTVNPKTFDFAVLMNPSVESVQHGTVRIFAYILSQILTKIDVDDQVIVVRPDQEFNRLMDKIVVALMEDVQASKGKYSLAVNEALKKSPEFKYYVFAEAFDSFYCNAGLREQMSKDGEFPRTHKLFLDMDRQLSEIQVLAPKVSSRSSGFSLSGSDLKEGSGPAFELGLLGGLFRGLGGVARGLGGGLIRGVGAIGRGALGTVGGIARAGGNLLGGAVRGVGRLLGFGGGGSVFPGGGLLGGFGNPGGGSNFPGGGGGSNFPGGGGGSNFPGGGGGSNFPGGGGGSNFPGGGGGSNFPGESNDSNNDGGSDSGGFN